MTVCMKFAGHTFAFCGIAYTMWKETRYEWETDCDFVYRVKQGETARLLATRFQTTVGLLIADNRLLGEVEEGDLLLVKKYQGRRYRIMPSDTPPSLQKTFGVSCEEILEKNKATYFYVGMDIIV